MGFLNDSSRPPSIYLEYKEEGTLVRPLAIKPQSVWVHKINEVTTAGPDGKPSVVRKFAYETCSATGRNGVGCTLCNMPDPLWHMLETESQTNRQGKRVDFPKTPIHLLPVYDHGLNDVVVMKGGNQPFEEMDKWYDAQPQQQQDLRRCDWRVSKTGVKKRTKYSSIRMDATAFQIDEALLEKAKAAMVTALQDRNPTSSDRIMQMIRGEVGGPALPEAAVVNALPPASFQTQQLAAPSFQQPSAPAFPQTAAPAGPPPQVAVAVPPKVTVTAAPGQSANQAEVDSLSQWITATPEFQGMGAVDHLIPVLKSTVGHVEYHKLTSEQVVQVKTALESKLTALRAPKS